MEFESGDFNIYTTGSDQPLAGFLQLNPPFFFAATAPRPAAMPVLDPVPRPSSTLGFGLVALKHPCVRASFDVWARQIARIRALPGSNRAQLGDIRTGLQHGFQARFETTCTAPPAAAYTNTFTFRQHEAECVERLAEYEAIGAMHWLPTTAKWRDYPYVQPLHAVLSSSKKVRICVDLSRNFNDFQVDEYFRFSSVRDAVALSQLCPGPAFYVKLDISSCYLSFPIRPADYKYFVCAVGERLLQFTSIVFGDSDAPRKVSLSLDIVSSALYDSGIAHTRYLDDF